MESIQTQPDNRKLFFEGVPVLSYVESKLRTVIVSALIIAGGAMSKPSDFKPETPANIIPPDHKGELPKGLGN